MVSLYPFAPSDWPLLWKVIAPVFQAGETYAFSPQITETEAYRVWIEMPQAVYVAKDQRGTVLGTYCMKPNQATLGAHVCNCGYIVSREARGRGVASLMCRHSQEEARRLGFRAMQFNLVVSSNEGAVRLWRKLGFAIVGTLPGAFKHHALGYVDAYVMYKQLLSDETAADAEE